MSAFRKYSRQLGILPVLFVVGACLSLLTPKFLTASNLLNVARQSSINVVLAAGMTLVILTGGIDLSVGSVLAVSAVVALLFSTHAWAFAVPAALASGLFAGAVIGVFVAKARVSPFVVTLGAYTAMRGAAYLLADGSSLIDNDISFAWIGNDYLGPVPWLVVIALLVVAALWVVLGRTVLGRHIYAVGCNAEAARLAGVRVPRVLILVYAICGLCAALGGVMTASRLYSANGQMGNGYELDAIAAVVLGGTSLAGGSGSIWGTLYGALLIAMLNNGLTLMNVSFYWQLVVKGVVIVVAITLDRFRTSSR